MIDFSRGFSGLRVLSRALLLTNLASIWQLVSSGPSSAAHLLGSNWRAHLATGRRRPLPIVDLWEILPILDGCIELPTRSSISDSLGGMVLSSAEALSLALLTKNSSPRAILEIGTAAGGTTRLFALNAPDAVIHTLDLPSNDPQMSMRGTDPGFIRSRRVGVAFEGTPEAVRIVQHLGDSANFDFRSLGLRFDLAFIDGSHSYEYVRSDTQGVLSVMADNGLVFWHDFGGGISLGYGVTEYLAEIQPKLGICLIRGTSIAVARIGNKIPMASESA